jgi:hypothetical protein
MPNWNGATGGITSLSGIPDYNVYVDPSGSDNASGKISAPLRTLYRATLQAIAEGGGNINFTNNTPAGGPIAGQGLWLRNDEIDIPGFIDIEGARLRYLGNGNQSSAFVFQRPGAARLIGGNSAAGDAFQKPDIWIVGSEVPIDFNFVGSFRDNLLGVSSPVRLGWDYARKPDFSLEEIDVTNASRDTGVTELTLDLATATPWSVVNASRDAQDIVTLTITRPQTVALSPWVQGSIIRVNTGADADFPDIDAIVISQSDTLNLSPATTAVTVTYLQAGATLSKALSGTVVSHGLVAGDYLYANFSNAEFVKCSQMTVLSATVDTVTVFDPYGYGARSATANENDVGTIIKQVRGRSVASGISFDACTFFGQSSAGDDFVSGPTIDFGGSSAALLSLNKTYVTGGLVWQWFNVDPENYDPSRTMTAILADPGGGTASGASLQASDCQSQAGVVRFNPRGVDASLYIRRWLQDSAGDTFATITCGSGNGFASVDLDDVANADASVAAVEMGSGYDPLRVKIGSLYSSNPVPLIAPSGCLGPTNIRSGSWTGNSSVPSPWVSKWQTVWSGGSSIQHPGPNRVGGPVQARFTNLIPPLADWEGAVPLPTGITITRDGLGPFGTGTAIKIVADASYDGSSIVIGDYPYVGAWAVGDYVAVGSWINSPDAAAIGLNLEAYALGTVDFGGSAFVQAARHIRQSGWQWCSSGAAKLTAITTGQYFLTINNIPAGAGTYYLYAPTIVRAAAAIGDQDFYEWAGCMKGSSLYLTAGISGTMEDEPFIAHGGIGSAIYREGAGAGEVTIVGSFTPKKYVKWINPDGTLAGMVEVVDGDINP